MSKVPKIARLQYFCDISKKGESDDVDFLGPDKHEIIVQIDTINDGGHG